MNWRKELEEKNLELAIVKSKMAELRKLERELKKEINGIENMIILEKNWAKQGE